METTGNAILVTGGGSGIGRALAEAFLALRSQVVIAGRRQAVLDAIAAENPGEKTVLRDLDNAAAVKVRATQLTTDHASLNAAIHCAGIMRAKLPKDGDLDDAAATIATNLLGPIRLNAELLGHLMSQPRVTVVTESSGLAFMPLGSTPTCCATSAAVHFYRQSLRYQL